MGGGLLASTSLPPAPSISLMDSILPPRSRQAEHALRSGGAITAADSDSKQVTKRRIPPRPWTITHTRAKSSAAGRGRPPTVMRRRLHLLALALCLCPCVDAWTRFTPSHYRISTPLGRSAAVVLADSSGEEPSSFSDAFASLAKAAKPQKPGEGAAQRTDVKGLPIRLGGSARDGSLGSIRAAGKNWEVLKDPRNWQSEEFGLIGVIVFTVAAFTWGYFEYVAEPKAIAPPPLSQAALVRQQKVAACSEGDAKCAQAALDSTQAAIDNQNALDQCLNYAFGGTEKKMCNDRYGSKSKFGF